MRKPFGHKLSGVLSAFAGVDGLAGIEFAILAPVLLLLTLCTVDLGIAAYDAMQTENAAQAGSEYAAVHGYNLTAISSVITQANNLPGLTAAPAPTEFCGCPAGSTIASVTCGSNCSDGSLAGTYVAASATVTYTTLLQYPMLPASFTFVNTATARIQ